jgi:hypothetical protein
MFSRFHKFCFLVYFLFLNFLSLSDIHIDHSIDSNKSHVCFSICEPVDICADKTDSGPHEEESFLEHILDHGGLCARSFFLKFSPAKILDFENLKLKIQTFLPSEFFVPHAATKKYNIFLIHLSNPRAPPILF